MDVFVNPDAANVARLQAALRELFGDPAVQEISASDLAGEYPAVQYIPPGSDYWIDILARTGGAFSYAEL